MKDRNMTISVNNGQVIVAKDNAVITQKKVVIAKNNVVNTCELDDIIKGIMENLSDLKKEDADDIRDIVDMAREELSKQEPKANRLRNCVSLLAPMITIVNGIPTLVNNLNQLKDFIMLYIH